MKGNDIMAKPVQSNKKTVNGKAVAAVTLAVILVLTIAAGIIGVRYETGPGRPV